MIPTPNRIKAHAVWPPPRGGAVPLDARPGTGQTPRGVEVAVKSFWLRMELLEKRKNGRSWKSKWKVTVKRLKLKQIHNKNLTFPRKSDLVRLFSSRTVMSRTLVISLTSLWKMLVICFT